MALDGVGFLLADELVCDGADKKGQESSICDVFAYRRICKVNPADRLAWWASTFRRASWNEDGQVEVKKAASPGVVKPEHE